MITTSDAIQVMTMVAACHRRTAPRMDDREATIATASIWAELFNEHQLELGDLTKAVKRRALTAADAPEPAEIIHHAREIRRERDMQTGPTTAYQQLCESKASDAGQLALTRDQAYGQHLAAAEADRRRHYDQSIAEWHARNDEPDLGHLAPAAIADCGLCNADGYRGGRICDHRDHFAETANGRALVQAELDKIRQRRGGAA